MKAAPAGVVDDLSFPLRRKHREKLTVVRDLRVALLLDPEQRIAKSHLAVTVMVAVAFSIGGDMDKLWPVARVVEPVDQPARKAFTAIQQALKSDRA